MEPFKSVSFAVIVDFCLGDRFLFFRGRFILLHFSFLHLKLEILSDFSPSFSDCVLERSIIHRISMEHVCAMIDEVLNCLEMSLGCSYVKSCSTIVVIGINSPPKQVEALQKNKVVIVRSVEESELLVSNVAIWKLNLLCLSAVFTAIFNKKIYYFLALSTV